MATMFRRKPAFRVALHALFGSFLGLAALSPASSLADPGDVNTTPEVIPELPVEIETEVSPAGSLKMVPLWKEISRILANTRPSQQLCPSDNPSTLHFNEASECRQLSARRPFFRPGAYSGLANPGAEVDEMPRLRVFNQCFNVLTGQPMRWRPDGEIDWNQPGYLFDPDEVVPVESPADNDGQVSNMPAELRTPIGALVSCPASGLQQNPCVENPAGALVVHNPRNVAARAFHGYGGNQDGPGASDDRIPPNATIVASAACRSNRELRDPEGNRVLELEVPVNENHFYAPGTRGRRAAETLGKALFWDMQVGSDAIQSCGTCHFNAGVDSRTRNQLNPNTNGGDMNYELQAASSSNDINVTAADFPFHRRDPDVVGDGGAVGTFDSDDVLSSMGVSRFKQFDDVLIGAEAFLDPVAGVGALRADAGTDVVDPIAVMEGNRRIEPRHTPTMHSAAFFFDLFWDGRARHDFNGGSVHGPSDPFFHVHVVCGRGTSKRLRELAAPAEAEFDDEAVGLCEWTEQGGNYLGADEAEEPVPVRIRFSGLASQAVGPPLSDFEMAFHGRNWAKIGKKLMQGGIALDDGIGVTPLANQLVAVSDSRLGEWSNQGGSICQTRGVPTAPGKPGLCTTYRELVRRAFRPELWDPNRNEHLVGMAVDMDNECEPGDQVHEGENLTGPATSQGFPADCDPFDGYVLKVQNGALDPADTNAFRLEEANFALFFGLAIQAYEQLLIPDHTPWDQFNDKYEGIGEGIGEPGDQGTVPPLLVRELVTGSPNGVLDTSLLDRPDLGIDGDDVLYGFDIFAGGNLTAALPVGSPRNPVAINPATNDPVLDQFGNPTGVGSNPFLRTTRCALCHLGPEQSDHTNNVNAGLLQSGTEQEFPFPQTAPEPTGVLRVVTGFSLAEELEENAQDGVEVENRNFRIFGDDMTVLANSTVAPPNAVAFQDNGVYNIGLRPTPDDILRGGDDPFGYPLSLAALALKNLGGEDFEPCDTENEAINIGNCNLPNFDPDLGVGGGLYELVGDCPGCDFEGTGYFQESINPGLQLEPAEPQLPEYLAEWANNLPAGEANPFVDELAFAPNTITQNTVSEYGEILFGADLHCGEFDPAAFGAGPPNFGWGPLCPNSQTGVPTNMKLGDEPFVPGSLVAPPNGTWGTTPFPNRVARNGAAKAPHLRNVELTGPYFHTGSYLTLRQVVDFYVRGGDWPAANREDRDPNLVNVSTQAFSFGSTTDLDPTFLDGIPDTMSLYDTMPDVFPPGCIPEAGLPNGPNCTPEPASSTPTQAAEALIAFLLSLTDERVAHRSAPFDQPEIFVPLDGHAPDNLVGRDRLIELTTTPCHPTGVEPECFLQVPATGRAGQEQRLQPFLGADPFAR